MFSLLGMSALACSVFAANLSPIDTFYPTGLNSTSYITNGSLGTNGGTYHAPANQLAENSPYGIYSYCSMPHPRVQEYELPSVKEAKIVYLEYFQRHQRRTMYNLAPGGENQPFDCSTFEGYLYGAGAKAGDDPMRVYGDIYTDPNNPFVDTLPFVNATCMFPQLTLGGLLDGFQHGKDLWAVYGEKLGLFPKEPNSKVWLRSSSSSVTQPSAGAVLRGIWPEWNGPLPLRQQANGVDTINRGYPCSTRNTIFDAIGATEEWNEHLKVTADLRATLGAMLGATNGAWQNSFDHFSDNFQARLCNGYDLPCSFTNHSDCVTTEQAEEVFRAGDWEWHFHWRGNSQATQLIQVVEGLFIGEIVGRLQAVLDGKQEYVYAHTFFHDGDIGPILGALGIDVMRWPGMASNVAIEIWEVSAEQFHKAPATTHYARVLYSGHPIKTIHGTLDWIELSKLISILQVYVPKDIISLCGITRR
ncbi:hypothetical protein BGW38_004272 [Lunasporangiospora selenospora]|uniref:Histidine phosphatase superfamily (Branch 2) n=1 Tax=Lunasporangiospora selenospora TaxID=979761 RepID=A0A9P6FPY2_9FUNG|nr:hypothetical protein BGW38_004272 [Lunasporangiospora selenospora]